MLTVHIPGNLYKPIMPNLCVNCGAQLPENIKPVMWDIEISMISRQPDNPTSIRFPLCNKCGSAAKALGEDILMLPGLICWIAAGVGLYFYFRQYEHVGMAVIGAILIGTAPAYVVFKITRFIAKLRLADADRELVKEIETAVEIFGGPRLMINFRNARFAMKFLDLNAEHGAEK